MEKHGKKTPKKEKEKNYTLSVAKGFGRLSAFLQFGHPSLSLSEISCRFKGTSC